MGGRGEKREKGTEREKAGVGGGDTPPLPAPACSTLPTTPFIHPVAAAAHPTPARPPARRESPCSAAAGGASD